MDRHIHTAEAVFKRVERPGEKPSWEGTITLAFKINEDKLRTFHQHEQEVRFDIASTLQDTREQIINELYKAFATVIVEDAVKGN